MSGIALVILAAGGSTRMGTAKQLLAYDGISLIRRAALTALETAYHPVVVVVGAEGNAIRKELSDLSVNVMENGDWKEGMASSVRAGLAAVEWFEPEGVVFTLGDQPMVTVATLVRLEATRLDTRRAIIAASYGGTLGVPAYFDAAYVPELRRLSGDRGCKAVILAHPENVAYFDCPEAAFDIDTKEDYHRLLKTG